MYNVIHVYTPYISSTAAFGAIAYIYALGRHYYLFFDINFTEYSYNQNKLNPIEQCKTVLKTATNNDSVAFSTVQLTITVGNMFHI